MPSDDFEADSRKILETSRLILRRLTTDDADFILALLNEPAFIRNVADRGIRTRADAADYIEKKFLASYASLGFGFYGMELKKSGRLLGICGFAKREMLQDVDIGFSLFERDWGNGYAFEASVAVLEYGRNALGFDRVLGITAVGNLPSIRLLEKLGLTFQGRIDFPGRGEESLLFG